MQNKVTEILCSIGDELELDTSEDDNAYMAVEEIAIEVLERLKELAKNQSK